jgi:DNA topoisomerase-1
VKHGKVNATIPKGIEPEALTMEEAVKLIAARAEKEGSKPAKAAKTAKAKATPKAAKAAKAEKPEKSAKTAKTVKPKSKAKPKTRRETEATP